MNAKRTAFLLLAMTAVISVPASAEGAAVPQQLVDSVQAEITEMYETNKTGAVLSAYDDTSAYTLGTVDLPAAFDLRDQGVVTPVKLQFPYGTCWAFGAMAASETSILSKLGLTYEEFSENYGFDMDLSERQTAYFVHKALPENADEVYDGQSGEGGHYVYNGQNMEMTGSFAYSAAAFFSDGIGPSFEYRYPYGGNNRLRTYMTTSRGSLVHCYSSDDDWSLSEDDRLYRDFDLTECNELICPAVIGDDGSYTYNPAGTDSIKRALLEGKGVAIAFCADNSMPGRPTTSNYMNVSGDHPAWAHYTYDVQVCNHEVCIVGWDDDYPAENFNADHMPPANGAWICKNSWGSVNSDDANYCDWGYEGSGYFYLSYYDRSIALPNTYDFDLSKFNGEYTSIYIDQYDYTDPTEPTVSEFSDPVSFANVFTADGDGTLHAVSVVTGGYKDRVHYSIVLLGSGNADPEDGVQLESGDVTFEYAGFHKIYTQQEWQLNEGDRYAVVYTIQNTDADGNAYYSVPISASLNEAGARSILTPDSTDAEVQALYYQKAVVNLGESFISMNGTWYDWADVIPQVWKAGGYSAYTELDNFSVKGFIIPA